MEKFTPGALDDNRPETEKARDYLQSFPEFASLPPLIWEEKTVEQWKHYPARNQLNSSSCVAQATCKAMYTMGYDIDSAHPIYRMRVNFSGLGMYLYDAADIIKKQGTVLESQDTSQNIGEKEMNKDLNDSVISLLQTEPKKISGYVYVPKTASWIEDIARAVADNKHCIITVQSNSTEWTSIPTVQGTPSWGHAICVVDYTLYQGKKYLIIEDSWGHGVTQFDDRRLLSEEFINARCTGALYLLKDTAIPLPLGFTFKKTLKRGSFGNEVVKLQTALIALGFMPSVKVKGYYGNLTEIAVNKFQVAFKSDILDPVGLSSPTGIFGALCIKKMNSILMTNKWFTSSVNPDDLSFTIKSALLGIVPTIMTVLAYYKVPFSENGVVQIVNLLVAIVSVVGMFYGVSRKAYGKIAQKMGFPHS